MNSIEKNSNSIYYPPGGILLWIIIFLELFTFGVALISLVIEKNNQPDVFHESAQLLNTTFGTINTIVLLLSGFFMAQSVRFFKLGNKSKTKTFLILTMLGGLVFLVLKGIEYNMKLDAGLTMGYNSFFGYYWLLTGFHVIHVVIGLVILLIQYFTLKFDKELVIEDYEAGAAFWHMCDLIWLLLFPILYLII